MDKWIELVALQLPVSIGIHAFEKTGPQPFRLDLRLALDADYRTRHDSIAETVDYDALRAQVSALMGSRHFNLQETLMQEVINICFALDGRVRAVDVRSSKTAVYPDCDSVGLHYSMTRAEWRADTAA
jgi:dihydroneopterin aldolase